MANTLGATAGTLIARQALDTLLEEFPVTTQITTDFSPEGALFNQPMVVKLPNALTANDYPGAGGYDEQDVSQQDVLLTINKHKHVTYGFNDTERSSNDIMLIERFGRNAGHALGKAMVDDLMALLLAASFTNSTVIATAAFASGKMADLRAKLNGRKIPSSNRFAVLNSDYYKGLAKDATLIANPGSPSGTVRSGQIGDVHGFNTSEYAFLGDNGEFLAGFAGVPEGLILATRVPTPPDDKSLGGTIEIVTEPDTKLSLQVRTWYDFKAGKEFRTFTIMYGVAKGNAACIERLVTQ